MTRFWSRTFGSAVGLVLPLALMTGCVDNTISLTIERFAQYPTEAAMTMCQIQALTNTSAGVGNGVLDVNMVQYSGLGYIAVPVVQNNLVERAAADTVEMDSIFVNGFDIELEPTPGDTVTAAAVPLSARKYRVQVSGGSLHPGGNGGTASSATIAVEVIPASIALQMASSPAIAQASAATPPLVVHMRPVGIHAGSEIDGGFVDFPVQICVNCLSPKPTKPCPTGGYPAAQIDTGSCNIAQDVPVTCCQDPTLGVVCGTKAPVKATM